MLWKKNALETVGLLTGQASLDVDTDQANRYCILLNSPTGKRAYYFSAPIYHISTGKLVRRRFEAQNGCYRFVGSRSEVSVNSNELRLRDGARSLVLRWPHPVSFRLQNGELLSDTFSVTPTFNGALIGGDPRRLVFSVGWELPCRETRRSYGCVALMESKFQPAAVLSALPASRPGAGIGPASAVWEQQTERSAVFRVVPGDSFCTRGMMEVSFYEPKLMQDTTVSGKRPNENDAFGPVAFIGKSNVYGTQWLYSRPDLSKVPELKRRMIRSVILYLPKYGEGSLAVGAFALPSRFCSFGSNWNNKVAAGAFQGICKDTAEYLALDLSAMYVSRNRLQESNGFVLAPRRNEGTASLVISTGDSYAMPQILCIQYSNH